MRLPILLLALAATPAGAQMVGEVGLPVGSEATTVTVQDLDGNPFDLAQIVGRQPVLLEFWATWCENCQALEPQMETAHEALGDSMKFLAIGVGVGQSRRSIARHLARHPSTYPYLYDARGAAVRAFRAPTTSYVVVLNRNGIVTYTGVGRDQNIMAAARSALDVQ